MPWMSDLHHKMLKNLHVNGFGKISIPRLRDVTPAGSRNLGIKPCTFQLHLSLNEQSTPYPILAMGRLDWDAVARRLVAGYKPCPDRGDGRAGGRVLLDIDGPVGLLLPHGRLIVPVDNV